jgi:hypothetical protein
MSKRRPEGIGVGFKMFHDARGGVFKWLFGLGVPFAFLLLICMLITGKTGC